VGNGTGQTQKVRRWADMVVMETWPSRGLTIHGLEIKTDRRDWQRELAQPDKAAEMARFCDCWSIAAPKGVVLEGEIPDGWGWYELAPPAEPIAALPGDQPEQPWRVVCARRPRMAPAGQDKSVPRVFVAAMLRAMQRDSEARLHREARAMGDASAACRLAEFERELRGGGKTVEALIAAIERVGYERGTHRYIALVEGEALARAVSVALNLGLHESWRGLNAIATDLDRVETAAAALRKAVEAEAVRLGAREPQPRRRKGRKSLD
jgi:hypothetical protein